MLPQISSMLIEKHGAGVAGRDDKKLSAAFSKALQSFYHAFRLVFAENGSRHIPAVCHDGKTVFGKGEKTHAEARFADGFDYAERGGVI